MPVDPLQLLIALLLINYLAVLTHELGHALLGHLAGYQVTACGLGVGRPLLRLAPGRTVFYLSWRRPFQGLTFSQPTRSDHSPAAEATLLAGGLAAHALWALALLPWAREGHWVLQVTLWLHVAYLAVGVIPVRFRLGTAVIESDARRILRVLRGAPSSMGPAGRFGLYQQCLSHLRQIRDAIGVLSYSTELALLELDCRNASRADELLADLQPLEQAPPYLIGRFELARWMTARAAGQEQAATERLRAAEAAFASDAGGKLTLQLLTLEQALDSGQPPEAVADRAAELLGGAPLPDWAGVSARWLLIRACGGSGQFARARAALAELRRPPAWITAWLDGQQQLADDQPAEALSSYCRAAGSLAPQLRGLDRPHRHGYLEAHERLASRIATLAAQLGADDRAGELESLLTPDGSLGEPIESHFGVLGAWFLGAGVLVDLVTWWAFRWATLPLLKLLVTVGPACCLAAVVSALAALFTRDRKRVAVVVLLLGLPAVALSLLLIVRLRLVLHPR